MKFSGRIRFLIGIIVVILLVLALSIHLNNIMSAAQSSKAELAADSVSIGTDYPGLVVKQNVELGDTVKSGQVLFEIQSALLVEALNKRQVTTRSLPFGVDPKTQNIQLKAPDDGIVEEIKYRAGSFAPAGGIIATVNTVGSLHVVAHFSLSPPDYARIDKSRPIEVRLPNNTSREADIFSVALVANGDGVDTVVKARLRDADMTDFQFSVGTPVEATLRLNQTSWYQGLLNYIQELFKPLGR